MQHKQNRMARWIVPGALVILAALGAANFKTADARPNRLPATAEDLAAMTAVRDALVGMGSLHVRASVELMIDGPSGVSNGVGFFEYWESGDRYRIDSTADPGLGFARGTSIAYDGARLSYYDSAQNLLSYSAGDTRNNPTSLPNPVFFMLDVLDRRSEDGCDNCRLRLADIDGRWRDASDSMFLGPDGAIEAVRYALSGHQVVHRIRMSPDGLRVVSVERNGDRQGDRVLIEFGGHDAAGLPRDVMVTSETEAGTLRASFTIEALEPAVGVDDRVFTIDTADVKTIWDSATDTFIKTRGWDRPVSMSEVVQMCIARRNAARGGGATQ